MAVQGVVVGKGATMRFIFRRRRCVRAAELENPSKERAERGYVSDKHADAVLSVAPDHDMRESD
jgi:hypothetical protein